MSHRVLDQIRSNNHRAISRLITAIESGQDVLEDEFAELFAHSHHALRIGFTGPPGAGKSTLINQCIAHLLQKDLSVGVVAVDPTSPFTGGALLGDRVRMNRFFGDDRVFIRSMGSQGDLGGLAKKAQDVGDVLAASGKDIILFETVGVGQGEHDIIKAVDFTVVVLVPESGDEIQLMKAGLIELADAFIINKADREGAGRLTQLLKNLLQNYSPKRADIPAVYSTIAFRNEGVKEAVDGILNSIRLEKEKGIFDDRRIKRYRQRVATLIHDRLLNTFWNESRETQLLQATQSIESVKRSPYKIAQELLDSFRYE
ncbi:MAG: methylmalonyl Co-A mutase-associated GTPase MeaB [Candidatus Neomarinimicrobiota bacterium]|nr:MAG: methylmalonyl Co-A mutase-associated GTPase MeaB [Candidatus Neomarinimicrobiota bacterium]